MRGPDVRDLHAALNWHLPPPSDQLPLDGPDGDGFGPRTEAKVKEFQRLVGFTGRDVDGVVGGKTRPYLFFAHDLNIAILKSIPPNPGSDEIIPRLTIPLPPLKMPWPPVVTRPLPQPTLHVDNLQLQAQQQTTIQGFHSFSSVIVQASVTLLTRQDGRHFELQLTPVQLGVNSSQSDSNADFSIAVQASASNIFNSPQQSGDFVVSLFGQAMAQRSITQKLPVVVGIGGGALAQFILKKDKWMLFWQGMPFLNIDGRGTLSVGGQVATGLTFQFANF